jgi:hypothetical protein
MNVFTRAALTVTALAVAVAGCSAGEPRLIAPGSGESPPEFGMIQWERKANVPFVLRNEFRVCLDRAGAVEIVELRFRESFGDLTIDDFAVVDIEDYAGLDDSDGFHLEAHGYEHGSVTVNIACPLDTYGPSSDNIPHHALGIEVSKPTDASAGGRDMIIVYQTASGKRRELVWPFEFVLCETDNSHGECEYPG